MVPQQIGRIMRQTESLTKHILRALPFILIVAVAIYAFIYYRQLVSLHELERRSEELLALRDAHYLATSLAFIGLYTLVVIISLPGAVILTLAGGFLFDFFPGVIYNVFGATLGALTVFSAARAGFGKDVTRLIEARGGVAARLQASLQENQWSVLFTMRLIPVLPFFITNLVPAFVGVRFWTFAITTFIGIIPADLIYTSIGVGLGDVFSRGERPELAILLQPHFLYPLLGLMLLAALPLVLKLFGKRKV